MTDQPEPRELAERIKEFLDGVEASAARLRVLTDLPLVPEEPFDPTWPEFAE